MDPGIAIVGLLILAAFVLVGWQYLEEARKNQIAFRTRNRSNAGWGMVPAAEVADQVLEWSMPKNKVIGVSEYELRAGNDLLGRFWLPQSGELMEAETCDGYWMAEYEERRGWRRAFEQTLTLRSVESGCCEASVKCGVASRVPGSWVGSIHFSDGCDFAWMKGDASQEGHFLLGWLRSRRVLFDLHHDVLLKSTGTNQITVSKQGASNHHLTLLALLVSYLEVWQQYESAD